MDTLLLDARDTALEAWRDDRRLLRSPAYALYDDTNGYQFGETAQAAARLQPRKIHTRFWQSLDLEPLRPALGPARHSADLVHAHLEEIATKIGTDSPWLLAVPASMRREQLALLLGILQSSSITAGGLVSRSVALAAGQPTGDSSLHLEIQLHQALLVELRRSGDVIEQHKVVAIPGSGLLQLLDRCAEQVARQFIEQCRFDPRRTAATEQVLYDTLPATLALLNQKSETELEINGFRARLTAAAIADAMAPLRDRIAAEQAGQQTLLLDPLASILPGLLQRFPEAILLPENGLFTSLQPHAKALIKPGSELPFISALPATGSRAAAPARPAATAAAAEPTPPPKPAPQPTPTHILYAGIAHPLQQPRQALSALLNDRLAERQLAGLELHFANGAWQVDGGEGEILLDNGLNARGEPLACGVSLMLDGEKLQLIRVAN